MLLAGTLAVLALIFRVGEAETTGVARVIDGDSLRIDATEIRLRGIDAPELDQTCTQARRDAPCGREARAALRRLVEGRVITCLSNERDRFGRLLARCRVLGTDVNAAMVRQGHAVASGAYAGEEAEAREAYAGVWSGTFERPSDWRRRHPRPEQP